MMRWRTFAIAICLVGIASFLSLVNLTISRLTADRLLYKKLPLIVDPENRREPLGIVQGNDNCDWSALVGMPDEYRQVLLEYTQAVLADIGAVPLTRQRFYHLYVRDPKSKYDGDRFPDLFNPVRDRDVIVPLVILPRPNAVKQWVASTQASARGWRTENHAKQYRGSVYGRTLVFEPGRLSREPEAAEPVSPMGSDGVSLWDYFHEDSFSLELGKLVDSPLYDIPPSYALMDRPASLHLGEDDGAKLLGEFITVPAFLKNTRLRWVSIQKGSKIRHFLAYALVDGNGVRRVAFPKHFRDSKLGPISAFVRPLTCKQHQPRINQHDELLLPTPLGWAPIMQESVFESTIAHEEWCLDDWFPAQLDACWVIREAEDSKPLQESFLLMPAREPSDRPVFFTALFAETEPKQLIQELAALYNVSPDKALNSPETMARLQSLFEKVRDFPLSK